MYPAYGPRNPSAVFRYLFFIRVPSLDEAPTLVPAGPIGPVSPFGPVGPMAVSAGVNPGLLVEPGGPPGVPLVGSRVVPSLAPGDMHEIDVIMRSE